VQQNLPLGWPVEGLFFVDSSHGWAYHPQNAAGLPPFGPGVEVLTTGDGGQTWNSVVAELVT
jgi:hypothetical protein